MPTLHGLFHSHRCSARRRLGGSQGLASCVAKAVTPATNIPAGCGNCQKNCISHAQNTHTATDPQTEPLVRA